MAPPGNRLPSANPIFANDFFYIGAGLASVLWLFMEGVGLSLTAIDVVTTHAGAYNFQIWASSAHNAQTASTQQIYQGISWVFALLPPLIFFIMLFQIGRHYPTHTAQQTHEALGMGKSALSNGLHFTGYLFAQMIHGLPFVTAIVSLATTAFGFWNLWEPDDPAKYFVVGLVCIAAAAFVYAFGPTLIVIGTHLWREAALDRIRMRRIKAAIAGGAPSRSPVPSPAQPKP